MRLEQQTIQLAASFYSHIGYTGAFSLSIDATAVIPMLKVKSNRLIGLASENEVVLKSAKDIINIINYKSSEKTKQANAFLLSPLQEHVPSFILVISPVYKGQDHQLVHHWFNQVLLWAAKKDMLVVGLGADGDSKVRKYYKERFKRLDGKRNAAIDIDDDTFAYNFVIENVMSDTGVSRPIPTLMFPDWRHLIKKWRNQLLNVKRLLILGDGVIQLEHLMTVFERDRMRCGLWKSDVFVKDKQNVQAAVRVLQEEVCVCMKDWDAKETKSTRAYLKMGHYMLKAYTEKDLTVQQHSMFAWVPVSFLRYWKAWLSISGFDIKSNFVSLQAYKDFILSGHSIIMSMKMFSMFFPSHPFQPWTFGSNSCEELFSMLRGFTRGKSDLCFMDMIDLSGRIQKLNKLKFQGKTIDDNILLPQWPQDIDNNLKKGMEMAEREVLKTLDHLSMLPALINANVVRKDGNDIVCINHPVLQTFTVWPGSENRYDGPDETTVISSEELLELDNGILLETLDQIDESHRGALISIAATASLQEGVEDVNEDEEDDSPSQCALYRNNACKYQDPSFKQPKTTNWIGCSYPTCNLWYHEQCLSLHITSEQTRLEYTLICPKHRDKTTL
jgi:hypothetical protein